MIEQKPACCSCGKELTSHDKYELMAEQRSGDYLFTIKKFYCKKCANKIIYEEDERKCKE